MENPNISSCIIAGYYKMDGRNNQYIVDSKAKKIIGMYDDENKKHQAGSVYDPNGLSPTLTTMSGGDNKQPFVLVNEGTKKGYVEATEDDSINIAYPNNLTKRGRVGKNISNTILTSPSIAVLENTNKFIDINNYKKMYNPYNNKTETKIINAYSEIDVALEEVDFVFVKKNGVYEGTDSCKYPFKVIHYELGIPCRFHDFRDTHATRLIESGADIKAVSKRLGHRNIDTTYNIYVRVTEKMESETANKFEKICKFL